jgi:UPF0755 protein
MIKKILLVFVAGLLLAGAYLAYIFFRPSVKIPEKENAYFYIGSSESQADVKNNLVKEKFISGNGFDIVSRVLKYKKAKPGRYKFQKGMSLFRLVKLLRNGQQTPVKIVIIKERTREMFAGKFGKGLKYDSETDSLAMISFLNNMDTLRSYGLDTNTVMAVIMPYTYEIRWNSTPSRIFRQFYTAYKKFWTTDRTVKADSLHLGPLEVITLASIVEEESNRLDDKLNIASTYINRIRKGMRLQADPTIKFALKNFALKRITGSLLQVNSPYNTYMYAGLPPGPICTPSVETLDAVLNAPETDYLFFVASHKFDGSSIFTTNLNDHQEYARLYQKELTRRMDSVKKAKAGK